ncbi:MAG: hypothetical protein O3A64_01495 [Proteobacteria bacterium]|nr:hypothetical protein [Pseudomonadota bacterium]
MSNYPLPKDPMVAAYLQHLKERDIKKASVCECCKQPSTNINSDGYKILFVCDDHHIQKDDVILDTSQPGVLHYIYPNGKKVPEHMMDPNVGHSFKPKEDNA